MTASARPQPENTEAWLAALESDYGPRSSLSGRDVLALVAAVRAVLALHTWVGKPQDRYCGCCSETWPCRSLRHVAAALSVPPAPEEKP